MKSLLARPVVQDQIHDCFFAFCLWVQLACLNLSTILGHIPIGFKEEGGVDVSVAAQVDTVLGQPNHFTFRR